MIPGNEPSPKRALDTGEIRSLSAEGKQISSEAFLRHLLEKTT